MPFNFDKKNTAYVLFIIVLILIISDLLVKKIFLEDPEVQTTTVLSPIDIDKNFYELLKNFGIDDKLIKRKAPRSKDSRHQQFSYTVTVPSDLPIPVILDDVYTEFSMNGFDISSEEKESGGKSIIKVSANDKLIISAEFKYSDKIFRKKGRVGIVISQFRVDALQDSLFFDIPESFCILLQPSKYNSKVANFVSRKNKEYAVLINDNGDELEFKLKGNYSAQRIKNIVRTIVGSFSSAVFFVVDDASDFFDSPGYKIVVSEIQKRKIKIVKLSSFMNLSREELIGVSESFKNIIEELAADDQKIILVTRDGFDALLPSIALFRKSGIKFVNPSAIGIK